MAPTLVIVVIGGDLAYSGKADQYELAATLTVLMAFDEEQAAILATLIPERGL
jgi:hypothetical protein